MGLCKLWFLIHVYFSHIHRNLLEKCCALIMTESFKCALTKEFVGNATTIWYIHQHMLIIRYKLKPHLNLLRTNCSIFYLKMAMCVCVCFFYISLAWHKHAPGVLFQKIERCKVLSYYNIVEIFCWAHNYFFTRSVWWRSTSIFMYMIVISFYLLI